jgi:hypothetical protein
MVGGAPMPFLPTTAPPTIPTTVISLYMANQPKVFLKAMKQLDYRT